MKLDYGKADTVSITAFDACAGGGDATDRSVRLGAELLGRGVGASDRRLAALQRTGSERSTVLLRRGPGVVHNQQCCYDVDTARQL